MTPIQEFRWCLSVIRKLFKSATQDIFQENHHNGFGFYVIFLLSLLAIWCYAAAAYDDDLDKSIRFTCVAGLIGTTQALIKYYLMRDLQHLLPTIQFIDDIYEKNSQPSSQYYEICLEFARISKLVIKVGLPLYLTTLIIALLAESIVTLLTGIYIPTLFIYFPGVHEYSIEMIVLSFIFNHIIVVFILVLIPPADMFFFILFANVPMVPLVIKGHLDELTKILELKQNVANEMEIKRRIVQLIEMQRRFNDNVALLEQHFFKFCILLFVTANGFSVIGVLMVVKEKLPIAYGIAAAGIFQITTYCVLGTIVENSSDRVYDAVCVFKWYKLPQNEQKNYHLLLHYAQQPQRLYIAGIKPLNMESCVSTIKGIYTFAMVLKSSMD